MTRPERVGIILGVEPRTATATSGSRVQVRVLGALEADRDGSTLRLAGGRQRTLLAVLAAAAGRVVTAEALTDALWGDELPADPPAALFNQVSRLRRVLGAALRTEPGGYRLDVAPDDVDAHAFERLLAAGRAAADAAEAVALLERAVTLWRGPAYDGLNVADRLRAEAVRLDDQRPAAVEALAWALLRSGRADEAAAVARAAVVDEPLREGLVGVLVRALALAGRQVEALHAYESYRRALAGDTGLEPSAALRRLQVEVLRGEVADPQPVRRARRTRSMRQATQAAMGRDAELAELRRRIADPDTAVVFVTGPAGIGKSTLLDALAGVERVVRVDGRDVEPTPPAFLAALDRALDDARTGSGATGAPDVADLVARLHDAGPVVLAVDSADQLLLLDSWWRTDLLPALPSTVTTVLAGRTGPTTAWWTAPSWRGQVRGVPLGPLPDDAASALLAAAGVAGPAVDRIRRYARGHPLALHLAAAADQTRPGLHVDPGPPVEVAAELLRAMLAETEPRVVATLEAASVLRRADEPLLAALLALDDAGTAWRELAGLPFVEATPDGLRVHDLVRDCVARMLASRDPDRHEELRRRAATHLSGRVRRQAAPSWRTTADLLYLARHPSVRDAFFPRRRRPRRGRPRGARRRAGAARDRRAVRPRRGRAARTVVELPSGRVGGGARRRRAGGLRDLPGHRRDRPADRGRGPRGGCDRRRPARAAGRAGRPNAHDPPPAQRRVGRPVPGGRRPDRRLQAPLPAPAAAPTADLHHCRGSPALAAALGTVGVPAAARDRDARRDADPRGAGVRRGQRRRVACPPRRDGMIRSGRRRPR